MRNHLIVLVAVLQIGAAPVEPTLDQLYAHCERTLSEGDAALLSQQEDISALKACVARARAAYGETAVRVALASCPT